MKTILQAKGQVTLPVEARRELGVRPRDEFAWVRNETGRWEICTFGQLVESRGLGSGELSAWSRRVKKGYYPKRT